jgi:hypothetical protein
MRDPRFDDTTAWARQQEPSPQELDAARSKAREVAAGPAEYERIALTDDASRLRSASWLYAYASELVFALRQDPMRQRAWADMLANAVDAGKRSFPPATSSKDSGHALLAGAEDWRREKDPFSVWRRASSHLEPYYRDWSNHVLSRLNLLLRIDPVRGLRICDGLPFPGRRPRCLRR